MINSLKFQNDNIDSQSKTVKNNELDLLTITILEACRQVYVSCNEQGEILMESLSKFVKDTMETRKSYESLIE